MDKSKPFKDTEGGSANGRAQLQPCRTQRAEKTDTSGQIKPVIQPNVNLVDLLGLVA
jgi:hypothetical protein